MEATFCAVSQTANTRIPQNTVVGTRTLSLNEFSSQTNDEMNGQATYTPNLSATNPGKIRAGTPVALMMANKYCEMLIGTPLNSANT